MFIIKMGWLEVWNDTKYLRILEIYVIGVRKLENKITCLRN